MKRPSLCVCLLVLLALPAEADILLLNGGGRVEGAVTEKADSYVVESLAGRAEIRKSDVASRIEAPYVTEVYQGRVARLEPGDAEARYELALWCRKRGLRKRERESLRAVIAIEPDHERARSALGYVRYEGEWTTPEDARIRRLTAAGLVEFEGKWFTPEGLEEWIRARREMVELRAREQARAAARAEEERRLREEEARRVREEEERRAREAALARAEQDRRERERLERENDALEDLVRDLLRRDRYRYRYYEPWPFGYARPSPLRISPAPTCRPRRIGSGFGLGFRWTGDDFEVRGRVR